MSDEQVTEICAGIRNIGDAYARVVAQRDELRRALQDVNRIASRGDVNVQPLLLPIRDAARAALAKVEE